MQSVMSFSNDKHEKFCRCQKCYSETKHKKLQDSELDFVEVFNKAIRKYKWGNYDNAADNQYIL